MRSTITLVATVAMFTIATQRSVPAQYAGMSPAGRFAGQVPGQGFAPPMSPTALYGENPVSRPLNVSDYEQAEMPLVTPNAGMGSGCLACDSRCADGSEQGCSCLCNPFDRGISRSFGGLEYLQWYNKGISLPALVTTSTAGTLQANAGVIGRPTTTVLFGNEKIDDDRQSGGRLTFGRWLDEACHLAVVGKFYGVEGGGLNFAANSTGNPILARPFFNANPAINAEDALLIAFPNLTRGSLSVATENDVLGAEVFGRALVDVGYRYRIDLLGGYQFNRIDSDLAISSTHTTGAATFAFNDLFSVDNEFHAGTLGLYAESYRSCWTLSALGKIALGNMHQVANLQGSNTVTAGGSVTTVGGLLTQPTNIGTFTRDVLVWAPEANFKLSCAVTERISLSVGYSFLYFTRVSFAGDQIDRAVNSTQLNGGARVGPARPAFAFRDTDFWVQSVDLGFSWNY